MELVWSLAGRPYRYSCLSWPGASAWTSGSWCPRPPPLRHHQITQPPTTWRLTHEKQLGKCVMVCLDPPCCFSSNSVLIIVSARDAVAFIFLGEEGHSRILLFSRFLTRKKLLTEWTNLGTTFVSFGEVFSSSSFSASSSSSSSLLFSFSSSSWTFSFSSSSIPSSFL